jgi:hypothetical protein
MNYMYEKSHFAAARGLTGKAMLAAFVHNECPFDSRDSHAPRIWHDELESFLRAGTHPARPQTP